MASDLKVGLRLAIAFAMLLAASSPAQTVEKADSALPKISLRVHKAVAPGELEQSVEAIERSQCGTGGLSTGPTTAKLAGGKVKAIRVLRVAQANKAAKADDIRLLLWSVWSGQIEESFCGPVWQEMAFWSIESELEFDDGKKGLLITDGGHVAMKDHDGRVWFTRIMPAQKQ
jgi:hypothetical protein